METHLKFIYSKFKLIREIDVLANNTVKTQYVWVGDNLLSMYTANKSYTYIANGNKNIDQLIDNSDGTIAAKYNYSPFGKLLSSEGAMIEINPFRFSSEYVDDETSLVYYNYRYYNPSIGKWLSRDPIKEQGGYNLYNFVRNDVINYTDTLGLLGFVGGFSGLLDLKFHHYGDWGGPGWAGGREVSDGWNNPKSKNYVPGLANKDAVDPLDQCYKEHDIDYEDCREIFPYCPEKQGKCMSDADDKAVKCQQVALDDLDFLDSPWTSTSAFNGLMALGLQGILRRWLIETEEGGRRRINNTPVNSPRVRPYGPWNPVWN